MKKIILFLIFAFALQADNHERKVIFDVMKSYKTDSTCRIIGTSPYVRLIKDQMSGNKKQVTVTREYSILTKSGVCPEVNKTIASGKYTCYLTKINREIDAAVSRLEAEGYCRSAFAPDPEFLKAFCEMIPRDEKCK